MHKEYNIDDCLHTGDLRRVHTTCACPISDSPLETGSRHERAFGLPARARMFQRDEDGSLIIFSLFIFILMLIIGGISVDIERFETARTTLQNTADGAALAAASLSQEVDGEILVRDYFTKAGMDPFIENITVEEAINFKRVTVDADITVPTHFMSMVGTEALGTIVDSIAEEAIGDVEISLVLDVSGSMRNNSKMGNLITAAQDFVETVYESSEEGSVSTTIVPYSTQVSAGADVMALLNRSPLSHELSHCLNFSTAEFSSASISTSDAVEQTLHFDPYTDSNWDGLDGSPDPVCPQRSWAEILPFSQDTVKLDDYIGDFTHTDFTSIEIGVKWGSAFLDPAFQPVASGLIEAGLVDEDFEGRPVAYSDTNTLKVMVVMTDGQNTQHYEMNDPYRTGNTEIVFVYYDDSGRPYYSIWQGEGEPRFEVEYEEVEVTECVEQEWNRRRRQWECVSWETSTVMEEVPNWYLTNDYSYDGVSTGDRSTPYGESDAVMMTWDALWANVPVEIFFDWLDDVGGMYSLKNDIDDALSYVTSGTKDTRTLSICSAAKTAGTIIYAIGFEAPYNSQVLLANCATSAGHYFNVSGTDISLAFSAIAADINRLRLLQ
ncbi:pilus assembly protein TadG-related protein [Pseudoruegeria sp. HB172150]|uniref:pilus assembly protein TadG-related protein n=1 Tax=Pseudoruegeria sp. HB172150 TaxID=2721164 RepID=UPI001556964E|nr:pilus assembly protein TadG-related protein [Pseudoruegeria sp. HB172150]